MEIDFLGSLREETCSSDLLAEVWCFPVSCPCSMDLDCGDSCKKSQETASGYVPAPTWPRTGCWDQQTLVQLMHLVYLCVWLTSGEVLLFPQTVIVFNLHVLKS